MNFVEPLSCSELSASESDVLYPQPFCPEAIAPRTRTAFDWVINLMAIALVAAVLLSALLQFLFLALGLVFLAAILYGLYRLSCQLHQTVAAKPPQQDASLRQPCNVGQND
ncbi:MAG: hypothetical protein Fur0046_17280 [Cyanobacteria bacterium J069]|nr:MAG: hypothetical protein D6742_07520 [Cyanobacteria bacterium J069]